MSRDVLRVVMPAIAAIGAIVASTLFVDWFIIDFAGANDIATITFDLREARACSHLGPCAVVPMSMIKGSFYPALAAVTCWAGLVFAGIVLYQAGVRVLGGMANEAVTRLGHLIGVIVLLTAAGAGYVFGPDFEAGAMMGFGVERGFGPSLMLLGLLAGHVALYYLRERANDEPAFQPVLPTARTRAPTHPSAITSVRAATGTRVPLPIDTPPRGHPTVPRPATIPPRPATIPPRPATIPPRPATIPPVEARTKTPQSQRGQTPTTPPPMKEMASQYKGKVKFAMVTGDISAGGIDARREDGGGVLVMWRDVVGIVVRRLPPELDGHPFVDIVSTAGMTLRVLPWSKLTGDSFADGDEETRTRAFVKLIVPRCREAKLDRASQSFLDDATKKPAQLPSLELLAKHDQALA